jgi:hypothetical protein
MPMVAVAGLRMSGSARSESVGSKRLKLFCYFETRNTRVPVNKEAKEETASS